MKAELDDYEKVPLDGAVAAAPAAANLEDPIPPGAHRRRPVLLNIVLFLLLWWYLSASQKHGHQSRTQKAHLPLVGLVLDLPTGTGSEGEKAAYISAAGNTKGYVTLNYGCSKTGDAQDMRQ